MTMPSDLTTKRLQYLKKVLPLHPAGEAETIISSRQQFHGLESGIEGEEQHEEMLEQRQRLQTLLDKIRENFWQSPLQPLQAKLESLETEQFPDLANAIHRMRVMARFRSHFVQLTDHKKFDGKFFEKLKRLLVMPPKEAPAFKNRLFKPLIDNENRKIAQGMIKLLKKKLPEVFELEREWFTMVLNYHKVGSTAVAAGQKADSDGSIGGYIGIAVVVIFVLIRLMRVMMRGD